MHAIFVCSAKLNAFVFNFPRRNIYLWNRTWTKSRWSDSTEKCCLFDFGTRTNDEKKKFQLTLKFIYGSENHFTFLLWYLQRTHVANETRRLFAQICAKINRKQWTKRRRVTLIHTHTRDCYRLFSHKLRWPMVILISRRWLLSANEVDRSHVAIGYNSQ